MSLIEQLDAHIDAHISRARELKTEIDHLNEELSSTEALLADSLRLYRTMTGSDHPSARSWPTASSASGADRPRLDLLVEALQAAGRPMTLGELVLAMPDTPQRGTVSAAAHRAVKKGLVRRTRKGVYEALSVPTQGQAGDSASLLGDELDIGVTKQERKSR